MKLHASRILFAMNLGLFMYKIYLDSLHALCKTSYTKSSSTKIAHKLHYKFNVMAFLTKIIITFSVNCCKLLIKTDSHDKIFNHPLKPVHFVMINNIQ